MTGVVGDADISIFQFHYGTIKSSKHRVNNTGIYLFQFHYGTIKRMLGVLQGIQSMVFQFHYGTIKRIDRLQSNGVCGKHFNSTMVRLKDKGITRCVVLHQHFNSTMVRLKVLKITGIRLMEGFISIPLWYD